MADIFRGSAHDLTVGHLAQFHGIICHQTVTALDQLNGQFAFADAAVAKDQDALAVHLHQHAVPGDAGRKLQIQHADQAAHQGAGRLVGAQQGDRVLLRQFLHLREGRQLLAAADDDRRGLLPEQLLQRFVALFCRQTGQKVHLCQTHDLQAELIEVIIVASQKQTRAVDLSDLHTDLIQLPGGVYYFHADAVGQRFKRNIERTHPGSSCILLPRCAAGTLIHIIIKFGGKYNARGAVFVPTAGNRRCIAARAQDFYIFLTLHGFYISAISDFTLFFYT